MALSLDGEDVVITVIYLLYCGMPTSASTASTTQHLADIYVKLLLDRDWHSKCFQIGTISKFEYLQIGDRMLIVRSSRPYKHSNLWPINGRFVE